MQWVEGAPPERPTMNQSSSVVGGEDDASAVALPAPGEVVGGKYRLTRMLGTGGMGMVFEAEHLRLRQSVAIKFLRPDVLSMVDAVERFEREARASCRMRSPHVVHVLDVDTDARGRPYMIMERLRGCDLEAELKTRGALPVHEAVDWILQACVAVAEAHAAGIVHRDLKPSNLFLADEAGTRDLKVLDFGISKVARDEPAVSSMAMTVGTPLYMSPEQVRSSTGAPTSGRSGSSCTSSSQARRPSWARRRPPSRRSWRTPRRPCATCAPRCPRSSSA
jgi:serine/threonine protein kinase